MPRIVVTRLGENRYGVCIEEGASESEHEVTVTPEAVTRYAGPGVSPERLLQASFAFLLEREPKEAIMRQFDLPVIERYFPEYPRQIRKRLAHSA